MSALPTREEIARITADHLKQHGYFMFSCESCRLLAAAERAIDLEEAVRAVFGLDERELPSEWFEQEKIIALRRLVEK